MKNLKKKHVVFYSLFEIPYDFEEKTQADSIAELIEYIKNRSKINRRYNINTEKFCLLESAPYNKENDSFELLFKSAKHSYRPPLINRKTVIERPNPKELDEGEIDKVHVIIKFNDDEVIICMEKTRDGVSINNLMEYFNYFMRKKVQEDNEEETFYYKADIIAKDNFMAILKGLKRVSIADIYFDKKILGSEYLNVSERSIGIKNSIMVSIKPNWGESVKEIAIDAFNKFNKAKNIPIQKIRLEGKNEFDGDVILNTDFIEKRETIDVEFDYNTGETSTKDTFRKLLALMNL